LFYDNVRILQCCESLPRELAVPTPLAKEREFLPTAQTNLSSSNAYISSKHNLPRRATCMG